VIACLQRPRIPLRHPWSEPKVITPGEMTAPPPSECHRGLRRSRGLAKWNNGENWKPTQISHDLRQKAWVRRQERSSGDCQFQRRWSAAPPKRQIPRAGQQRYLHDGPYEITGARFLRQRNVFRRQAAAITTTPASGPTRCVRPGRVNTYELFWTAPVSTKLVNWLRPAYINRHAQRRVGVKPFSN